MLRRHPDLVIANFISLFTTLLVINFSAWQSPIRIILGLSMSLVVPGYLLTALLFPKRDDIDLIERLALSLGLSVATIPLLGLALNYTSWGIQLAPICLSLSLFILSLSFFVIFRRSRIPVEEWGLMSLKQPSLSFNALLALGVLIVIGSLIALAPDLRPQEQFSEFYILGPEGKLENYPSTLEPGANYQLSFGISNHEGSSKHYRILGTNPASFILEIDLANEESFEQTVTLQAPTTPGRVKIPFELYLDKQTTPYRSLHLFINISDTPTDP